MNSFEAFPNNRSTDNFVVIFSFLSFLLSDCFFRNAFSFDFVAKFSAKMKLKFSFDEKWLDNLKTNEHEMVDDNIVVRCDDMYIVCSDIVVSQHGIKDRKCLISWICERHRECGITAIKHAKKDPNRYMDFVLKIKFSFLIWKCMRRKKKATRTSPPKWKHISKNVPSP